MYEFAVSKARESDITDHETDEAFSIFQKSAEGSYAAAQYEMMKSFKEEV